MTDKATRRYFYRRIDEDGPSSSEAAVSLAAQPGLSVIDVRPRMILVEGPGDGGKPSLKGWQSFEETVYDRPDTRPQVKGMR